MTYGRHFWLVNDCDIRELSAAVQWRSVCYLTSGTQVK